MHGVELAVLQISFTRGLLQEEFDKVLQSALQVSTSTTGSLRASSEIVDASNRWSYIGGCRSVGRFAVASTRTGTKDNKGKLKRQASWSSVPQEVADTSQLGVELDLQIGTRSCFIQPFYFTCVSGQMTLRAKHLTALDSQIANQPDVSLVFGDATMQASLVEKAEHRHHAGNVMIGPAMYSGM